MLESLVATVLNRVLGAYVKNFDPKQLNIGIWNGDVQLRNLELKKEALDKLKLPIDVVEGYLGQLTLQIPWSNLKSKPVKVMIDKVYVLALPRMDQEYDEEEEFQREQAVKQQKLEQAELLLESQPAPASSSPQDQQKKQESFTESLVTKIIDNLQIFITSIHIRYEDAISSPGHPFAIGFTLSELSAFSTDENWKAAYLENTKEATRKLTRLSKFGIYFNTDTEFVERNSTSEFLDNFSRFIARENEQLPLNQYVLQPVSGSGKVTLNKVNLFKQPRTIIDLMFDAIGLVLQEDQYRDTLLLTDLFHSYLTTHKFKKFRPKESVDEDPRAWVRYAGNVVLEEIHQRNKIWTWAFFKDRRDDRIAYMKLFRAKLLLTLTPDESQQLKELEEKLSYEDIIFYRGRVRAQLRKERKAIPQNKPEENVGWLGWLGWKSKPKEQEIAAEEDATPEITEEQKKEFYDAIDWNEDKPPLPTVETLPRHAVKWKLNVTLAQGSLLLRKAIQEELTDILSVKFDFFRATVLQRPDSFLLGISLDRFDIFDGTIKGSLYPQVAKVNKLHPDTERIQQLYDDDEEEGDNNTQKSNDDDKSDTNSDDGENDNSNNSNSNNEVDSQAYKDAFFQFTIEINPLDESADIAVTAKLRSMELYYNPFMVVETVRFFKPPRLHMHSIGALMQAAGETVQGITNQTRAGLEYALENHKTVNAKLDLQAPLIIIPLSMVNKDSSCLIIDFGQVHIRSNLVDRETLKSLQQERGKILSSEKFHQLESLMYDKFRLELESTQVLLGPNFEETMAKLHARTEDRRFHIINRISMQLMLEISILPTASNIAKVRLSGNLPIMQVFFSDWKYKTLMQIIDHSIPKFTDSSGVDDANKRAGVATPSSQAKKSSSHDESATDLEEIVPAFQFSESRQPAAVVQDKDHQEQQQHAAKQQEIDTRQKIFEFNFTVEKIEGHLYRYDADSKELQTLLVILLLEHSEIEFFIRKFDMFAMVVLKKLNIEDFIEETDDENFRCLVTSEGFADTNTPSSEDSRNLFKVQYTKADSQSPEFESTFSGVNQNVDVSMSTLDFAVSRRSLLTLLNFVITTFTAPNENAPSVTPETGHIQENPENNAGVVKANPSSEAKQQEQEQEQPEEQEDNKIKVHVNLNSIGLALNDSGICLATLKLSKAIVDVALESKGMTIGARLGQLVLRDDINQGAASDSELRQLISIEGDELAVLKFQTFNPQDSQTYPGHDMSIYFRAGSIKINFIQEPIRKIIAFMSKFNKMKALYDGARLAAMNQASQISSTTGRMKLDIIISTPIVVFPKPGFLTTQGQADTITAHLGEVYLNNEFENLDKEMRGDPAVVVVENISAGIRKTSLSSVLYFPNLEGPQRFQMIQDVNVALDIVRTPYSEGSDIPEIMVNGTITQISVRITELQYQFLIELTKAIPAIFEPDDEDADDLEDLENTLKKEVEAQRPALEGSSSRSSITTGNSLLPENTRDQRLQPRKQEEEEDSPVADLTPELGPVKLDGKALKTWVKLEAVFSLEKISLELFYNTYGIAQNDLDAHSLSQFSLNDTSLKLRMLTDSDEAPQTHLSTELRIKSFVVSDSRQGKENLYREIIPTVTHEGYQFLATATVTGGSNKKTSVCMLAVDSPRIIFALDYLFAVKDFLMFGITPGVEQIDEDERTDFDKAMLAEASEDQKQSTATRRKSTLVANDSAPTENGQQQEEVVNELFFRINVVDSSIILIADPTSKTSEAMVLSAKQFLVTKQSSLSISLSRLEVYLCQMSGNLKDRCTILEPFSIMASMNNRDTVAQRICSITAKVETLVLRLSTHDILLVMSLINRASELSKPQNESEDDKDGSQKKRQRASSAVLLPTTHQQNTVTKQRRGSQYVSGGALSSVVTDNSGNINEIVPVLIDSEDLTVNFDGLRLVLIGDPYELSILDFGIKPFSFSVRNWSGVLELDANLELYTNIINFASTAWEPLVESWHLGIRASRERGLGRFDLDIYSRQSMEITITSRTVALASQVSKMVNPELSGGIYSKPRGTVAPVKLINETGYPLQVWSEGTNADEDAPAVEIADGQWTPFRIYDWKYTRENVVSSSDLIIGARLKNSPYDTLSNISIARVGESLFALRPKAENITHRLLCEVKLGTDNVKSVIIRSSLSIENSCQIPIQIFYENSDLEPVTIVPGTSRAVPISVLYDHAFKIRPDPGFGYKWSGQTLFWRNLVETRTVNVACSCEDSEDDSTFNFIAHAIFNRTDVLNRVYPHMKVKISAPLEIINLLPCDFNYHIYDKATRKDWMNFLRQGGSSPVHTVKLTHLLLLSVKLDGAQGFSKSDFAIVNAPKHSGFIEESVLNAKSAEGNKLDLHLLYHQVPDSGGAFTVTVFSAYLILNKTGLDLQIRSRSNTVSSRLAPGLHSTDNAIKTAIPRMFSFSDDSRSNRAVIRVADSEWSAPQSFYAVGSASEIVVDSNNNQLQYSLGMTVNKGDGKYSITKVITITPRYIIKNKLAQEVQIKEEGAVESITLGSGNTKPFFLFRAGSVAEICLSFPGAKAKWSSPVCIRDMGKVHVRVMTHDGGQELLKVEMVLSEATVFVLIDRETKGWPFSIRNFTDLEFTFYQANPRLFSDELDPRDKVGTFKPSHYLLPKKSVMPYSWDYPSVTHKELIICCGGKERHVQLQEIGNLVPMRVPATADNPEMIIDINVVADGPTQTLVLSDYDPELSQFAPVTSHDQKNVSKRSLDADENYFRAEMPDKALTFKFGLSFEGIGISLVNALNKELCYITFRRVELDYFESDAFQAVSAKIKWIQIDNSLFGGVYSIIMYPTVVPATAKEIEVHPTISASVTRVKDDSHGVLYIKYATVLIQELTMEMDEDFLFALIDFTKFPGASWNEKRNDNLCDMELTVPEPVSDETGTDVYFEVLHLQPAQLNLSFVRTERVSGEEPPVSQNSLMFFFFNALTMAIGNINDAPVKLNSLYMENVRVSFMVLGNNIATHYSQEFLYQIYNILGSADFIGNPVGLWNNISSGVMDIFYEPYQGYVMTDRPQDLGIGIARGGLSFVRKTVFGVSDSITKITDSITKGLALVTLDQQYQDRRRIVRSRNKPQHAITGFTSGTQSLIEGIGSGLSGLALEPAKGAQFGTAGLLKGIGRGLVGLPTKAAIGVFDFAGNISEGVRNTTTVFDSTAIQRIRPSRFIDRDGVVRPYSQYEALGQMWLKQVDDGAYFKDDYLAHLDLRNGLTVIVTYSRIMLVSVVDARSEWILDFSSLQALSMEKTGINITLKGGRQGPFIPIPEATGREFLHYKLAYAVSEYNARTIVDT